MFDGAFANPVHWILAIVVLVLVFGANKLGDVGGALGKSVKEFKKATQEDDAPPAAASAPAASEAPPVLLTVGKLPDYYPKVSE
jgi:TatA/E family protein of Tat protein translocase